MTEPQILNQRYRLEEMLGSGGMAVVYRAVDLMLERPVAVKILRQNFTDDEEFRERFRQEARAAANLSHPNIVTVHDFGISDGHPFIVMEFVPGQHLKRIIQQQTRLSVEDSINLIIQACAGIGYAHRAGIVHCDIKPHNMVVTPDMQLKMTDFGIARALASIQPDEQAEIVWGSPQYFSPEQAAGSAPSPASDVYSLGVVLYEMLTGALPYQASTSEELAKLHQSANPIPLRTLNPAVPPDLEKIVLKLLSKEPAARYRTADQLGHILEALENGTASETSHEIDSQPMPVQPAGSIGKPAIRPTPFLDQPAPAPRKPPETKFQNSPNLAEIDWATVLLWLLAVILVGGLIPFWLWVILRFNVGP